jgi:transcription initiation factor TFIIIB Brf1 subunit/transcription initiation factor TFIIB
MNEDEICPVCGSLDVIPDYKSPNTLVCLDCGHEFPAKHITEETLEDSDTEQENSDLEEIEEEWIE